MTTETYVTQANAARILERYFESCGKPDTRNFQYLLNDQRRGRHLNPIPFEKVRGRIMYRVGDLEEWASFEAGREKDTGTGIFEVEGDTSLERLVKLSVAVATIH